ncbi:unnamed protein product [Diabrotica balteata]|uniref:Reverse transcriptase domain-containing protein n=1 Tax=Diabrotica balteata TaxID=107213 RepID=A0A9N9TDE8_DIABA|nr:unnamed protein product [Diabrotica balteata]
MDSVFKVQGFSDKNEDKKIKEKIKKLVTSIINEQEDCTIENQPVQEKETNKDDLNPWCIFDQLIGDGSSTQVVKSSAMDIEKNVSIKHKPSTITVLQDITITPVKNNIFYEEPEHVTTRPVTPLSTTQVSQQLLVNTPRKNVAIKKLKSRKAEGEDGITGETLKAIRELGTEVMLRICNEIWNTGKWTNDWADCSNYRTVALISHASKVLLTIINKRLKLIPLPQIPQEQCGFVPGRETREHILNICQIIEKSRECLVDYSKAFDTVKCNKMWHTLSEMSTADTANLFITKTIVTATIRGRKIKNLRYADDTVILASSPEELEQIVNRLGTVNTEYSLKINMQKSKVMIIDRIRNNQSEIKNMTGYEWRMRRQDPSTHTMARSATAKLTKIWKNTGITKNTKLRLVRALIFPIATYASETWTITKADSKRTMAFEMWVYRRMLRIPWTAYRTNNSILAELNIKLDSSQLSTQTY